MNRLLTNLALLLFLPAVATAQARTGSIFMGMVVDSVQRPIANAEISFPMLALEVVTDERGTFRIMEIPPGAHRLVVRRIGFGRLDTTITFAENQSIERRITLGRIVTLDSIRVAAPAPDPLLNEFAENMRRGMGNFLTRDELAKLEGQTLGSVMGRFPAVNVMRGRQGQAWIGSRRGPMSRCPPTARGVSAAAAQQAQEATDRCLRAERMLYVPDEHELREQGMYRACFAVVYMDQSLMNAGRPTQPFDLSTITPDRIEAIEWYSSASQAPAKYNAVNAQCGIAVIHTRRRR